MHVLEKNSVQINDLSPDTAYLFKVQAFGGDGNAGGSSMEEQFETLPEGKQENHWKSVSCFVWRTEVDWWVTLSFLGHLTQNNTAVIFGAAVGGAAMLFIVIAVLFLRRRSVNVALPVFLYALLVRLPLSFICPSFPFTPSSPLRLSSFSQLSPSLYLDLCRGAR